MPGQLTASDDNTARAVATHLLVALLASTHLCQITLLSIPQLLGLLQVLCGLRVQLLPGQDHTQLVVILHKQAHERQARTIQISRLLDTAQHISWHEHTGTTAPSAIASQVSLHLPPPEAHTCSANPHHIPAHIQSRKQKQLCEHTMHLLDSVVCSAVTQSSLLQSPHHTALGVAEAS